MQSFLTRKSNNHQLDTKRKNPKKRRQKQSPTQVTQPVVPYYFRETIPKIYTQTTDEENEACIFDGEFDLVVLIDVDGEIHDNKMNESHHEINDRHLKGTQQQIKPTQHVTTSIQTTLKTLINMHETHHTHITNSRILQIHNINWPPKQKYKCIPAKMHSGQHLPPGRKLSFATFNAEGPSFPLHRLVKMLYALPHDLSGTAPMAMCISQYRLDKELKKLHERASMELGYLIVSSPRNPNGGLAILTHIDLVGPKKPKLSVNMPGTIISFETPLNVDPIFPSTQIFGFHSSTSECIRTPMEKMPNNFLGTSAIFMGDCNGVTIAMPPTHQGRYRNGSRYKKKIDTYGTPTARYVIAPHPPIQEHIYRGTSYINKIYVTAVAIRLFKVSQMNTYEIVNDRQPNNTNDTANFSDHDFHLAYLLPWSQEITHPAGCN